MSSNIDWGTEIYLPQQSNLTVRTLVRRDSQNLRKESSIFHCKIVIKSIQHLKFNQFYHSDADFCTFMYMQSLQNTCRKRLPLLVVCHVLRQDPGKVRSCVRVRVGRVGSAEEVSTASYRRGPGGH